MKVEQDVHPTRYRTYVFIWVALVILTGLTASLSIRFEQAAWAILISIAIAATKSGLVLAYFMHLKSEKLLIFKIIIPLVLASFLVFVILTFADVAFRGGAR